MGLYTCLECDTSWLTEEAEICEECGSSLPDRRRCPECGSERWNSVDTGEELFYLIGQGLSPARSLYYFLNRVHGVPISDIAEMCGRTETSVYNVVSKAEEALGDG